MKKILEKFLGPLYFCLSRVLPLEGINPLNCTLTIKYTFNRYIKKYEPSSPVAKAYAEFAKEVSADGRKKERLHSADAR